MYLAFSLEKKKIKFNMFRSCAHWNALDGSIGSEIIAVNAHQSVNVRKPFVHNILTIRSKC